MPITPCIETKNESYILFFLSLKGSKLKIILKLATINIALMLLPGCVAKGPLFQPAPPPKGNKALVYFVENTPEAGAFLTHFCVNEKKIVSLYSGGYSWAHIDAGESRFSWGGTFGGCSSDPEAGFRANLSPSKEYLVVFKKIIDGRTIRTKISLENSQEYRHVLMTSKFVKSDMQ